MEDKKDKEKKKKLYEKQKDTYRGKVDPRWLVDTTISKEFIDATPAEKYRIVWGNRNIRLFQYKSIAPANTFDNVLNHSDQMYLDEVVAQISEAVYNQLLNDARFALMKQSISLSQADRVKLPNFAVAKTLFDAEYLKVFLERLQLLVDRVRKAAEDEFDANPITKTYLMAIHLGLDQRMQGFKCWRIPPTPAPVEQSIVDIVLKKLGKETITEEELNKFSDFFTGLPAKKGAVIRKELATKILNESLYQNKDAHRQALKVEDRFGNTLFSMAISAVAFFDNVAKAKAEVKALLQSGAKSETIAAAEAKAEAIVEAERAKYYGLGPQTPALDETRKINKLLVEMYPFKTKRRMERLVPLVDTPITKYLNDPARETLRAQLGFLGVTECYEARYPSDPSKQEAFYKELVAKVGPYMKTFLRIIQRDYIDYSNSKWVPIFVPIFKEHGFLGENKQLIWGITPKKWEAWQRFANEESISDRRIAKRWRAKLKDRLENFRPVNLGIITRLTANIMQQTLFVRIYDKITRLRNKATDEELPLTSMGKQIKELFQLSFKGYKDIKQVMEIPEFKFDNPDGETEQKQSDIYNFLAELIRKELPRQLLFYHVVYRDTAFVRDILEEFSGLFSNLRTVNTEESTLFQEHVCCAFFEQLPVLYRAGLKKDDLDYAITRAIAFKQDFRITEKRKALYLGLLGLENFRLFQTESLADVVFQLGSTLLNAPLVKRAANFNPMHPKQAISKFVMAANFFSKYGKEFGNSEFSVEEWFSKLLPPLIKIELDPVIGLLRDFTFFEDDEWIPSWVLRKTGQSHSRFYAEKKYRGCKKPGRSLPNYNNRVQNAFNKKFCVSQQSLALDFCRQALEILSSFYHDELGQRTHVTEFLGALHPAIGIPPLIMMILKFVARNYPRGTDGVKEYCVFLINDFLNNLIESGVKTSLIYNRFIRKAIDAGRIGGLALNRLLNPVTEKGKDHKSLSQGQLLHIVMLAELTDFQVLAKTEAFSDDEKLFDVLNLNLSVSNLPLKAELQKLMKIPGMTPHCLHYLHRVQSLEVDELTNMNHYALLKLLLGLSDYDFAKLLEVMWKQPCLEEYKMVLIAAGLGSGSFRKLCAVLSLCDLSDLSEEAFDSNSFGQILGEYVSPFEQTLSFFLHSRWMNLGRFFAICFLSIFLRDRNLKRLSQEQIKLEFLPDIMDNGLKFFKHQFLSFKNNYELSIQTQGNLPEQLFKMVNKWLSTISPVSVSLNIFCDQILFSWSFGKLGGVRSKKQSVEGNEEEDDENDLKYAKDTSLTFALQQGSLKMGIINSVVKVCLSDENFFDFYGEEYNQMSIHEKKAVMVSNTDKAITMFSRELREFKMVKKEIEMAMELFNYKDLASSPENRIRIGLVLLMVAKMPSVREMSELARDIQDFKVFAQILMDQFDYLMSCPSISDVENIDRDEDGEAKETTIEEEYFAWAARYANAITDKLVTFTLVYAVFLADGSILDQILAKFKTVKKETMELVYRLYNFREEEILKIPTANKTSVQKVKAFVQSGAYQPVPIPPVAPKGDGRKTGEIKECLEFMDLTELGRANITSLASNPGIISSQKFLTENKNEILTFSEALIKQIFSDPNLAIAKLMKAYTMWQRGVSAMKKLPPTSFYTPTYSYPGFAKQQAVYNPFYEDLMKSEKHVCRVHVVAQGERPNNPSHNFILQVWFEPGPTPEEFKTNYKIILNRETPYEFDPKARQNFAFFDLITLKTRLEDQIRPVEEKLGTQLLQKYEDKQQALFDASILQLPHASDRSFFSTSFGENFSGHTKPNEKFFKKQKAYRATAAILNEAIRTSGMTNAPLNLNEPMKNAVGLGSLNGQASKCASVLSAWDASINS